MAIPYGRGRPFDHEMAKSNPSLAITSQKREAGRPLWPKERFGHKHGGALAFAWSKRTPPTGKKGGDSLSRC
jgi:hypothetical protein